MLLGVNPFHDLGFKPLDQLCPRYLDAVSLSSSALAPLNCASSDPQISEMLSVAVVDVQFDSIVSEVHCDR